MKYRYILQTLFLSIFLLFPFSIKSQIIEETDEFTGLVEISYEQPKTILIEDSENTAMFVAKYSKKYGNGSYEIKFFIPSDSIYPSTAYFLIDGERTSFRLKSEISPYSSYSESDLLGKKLNETAFKNKKKYPFVTPQDIIVYLTIPESYENYFSQISEAKNVRARIGDRVLILTPDARKEMKDIYKRVKEL